MIKKERERERKQVGIGLGMVVVWGVSLCGSQEEKKKPEKSRARSIGS
jgi:hypothetical protein